MLAARAGRIATSPTMKVAAEAIKLKSQGIDVVDFGAGEPDFPTPPHIGDAAKAAIDANFTKYTTNSGTEELKKAVVARYREDYGVEFSTAEVIITAGGKQALYNAAMVLFGPGDEVITHMPGWPTLVEQIKLAEATPVIVHTRAEEGFSLRADSILAAVTPRTRGIIINSPGNPTGALITEEELARVADEAARRGIWILIDLCYEKLIYDPVPHNLVKVLTTRMRDRTVICGSASKAYAMTGWRCGWAIAPKEVIAASNALQSHSTSNVCSITQKAVVAGLLGPQDCVTTMLDEYRRRRDQVCTWLAAEPRIRIVKPAGAFYLFPDFSEFLSPDGIRTTAELAQALLDEARVAITPGEAFDAPGFIRLSYATSMHDLQRGTAKILEFVRALENRSAAVGAQFVRTDDAARTHYGTDALKRGRPADAVVLPHTSAEVSAVMRLCNRDRVPVVPRGAGTGYTGGSIPVHGGVVLSLERMNRILEIDEANLLAVVEPNVITGDLQDAVEAVGLFYPPDPASLRTCAIGGNVAECAGGPRAFKYGTTRNYVLGLEAVLPTGEIVETGGKTVKNVVGYDLTGLLVGSEGTLAVITRVILRLVPQPPFQATIRATFGSVAAAAAAVINITRARVVPAALELIDGQTLEAAARNLGVRSLAPEGTGALLLVEVDGVEAAVGEESQRVATACREAGAAEVSSATAAAEREELWRVRREMSFSLKTIAALKINHDIVVPKGRIPQLFELVARLRREFRLQIPSFGHAGDGNIHVNFMIDPEDAAEVARARAAEPELFRGVVALEGSISGEHGIGITKSAFLPIELSAAEIALMQRVKLAFDPNGILNPGKIFPA